MSSFYMKRCSTAYIIQMLQMRSETPPSRKIAYVLSSVFVSPQMVAHQAPLSMEFFRQEYWSWLPFPIPGGSSQSKDQIRISCVSYMGRQILHHYAMWEGHPIRLEWLKSKTLTIPTADECMERQGLPLIACENVKWCNHFGRQPGSFLQK